MDRKQIREEAILQAAYIRACYEEQQPWRDFYSAQSFCMQLKAFYESEHKEKQSMSALHTFGEWLEKFMTPPTDKE